MKKTLLFLLSICLLTPAFADERDRAVIASTPDDRVQLELLSRLGYGFHIVRSTEFKPAVSGAFFFNIMQFDVFPSDYFGISLGVDCSFSRFSSKGAEFYLDSDRKIQVLDLNDSFVPYGSKLTGGFKHFSFNAPLMLRAKLGDFKISVGAELDVNLPGTAYYVYTVDNKTTRVTERKARLNRVSGAAVASITFCDLGFFAKYYPGFAPLLPAGSVSMSYWSIGFIYGM